MASITKNDKTIIMRDKYFDVLGNSPENFFLHHFVCLPPGVSIFSVREIYIYGHIAKMATFQNEVGQLQKFSNFLKISRLSSIIHFLSREREKFPKKSDFW